MVQIMIFAQAIVDPVGMEQRNLFVLSKEEAVRAEKLGEMAASLLTQNDKSDRSKGSRGSRQRGSSTSLGKRSFGESLLHIVRNNEPQWASWKKDGCLSFEVRSKSTKICNRLMQRRETKAQ